MNIFGYIKEDQERNSENSRTKLFLRLLRIQQAGGVLSIFARIITFIFFDKYCVDIDPVTKLGVGLRISHLHSIVVSRYSIIGDNCTIFHQVTIGVNDIKDSKAAPVIGNNCYIGAGATIIGNIIIGENSIIGANATVTKDIPNNSIVVGNNIIKEHCQE